MKPLDAVDKELLRLLQNDAEIPVGQLAEAVNLSSSPCWRRVQRLKDEGYITRQVALLDPHKLNLGITVFVSIRTNQHSDAWFDKFNAGVTAIPEVVEFYRMSGDVDYLLRVVVPNIAAYDSVYHRLIRCCELFDVSSSFAMEQLKFTTALPLNYID
ncbi:MAG: Lrp/AsnC family transcriptional regulator [Burkholderiaceae bacterium]